MHFKRAIPATDPVEWSELKCDPAAKPHERHDCIYNADSASIKYDKYNNHSACRNERREQLFQAREYSTESAADN